jgi:hypothetical protein
VDDINIIVGDPEIYQKNNEIKTGREARPPPGSFAYVQVYMCVCVCVIICPVVAAVVACSPPPSRFTYEISIFHAIIIIIILCTELPVTFSPRIVDRTRKTPCTHIIYPATYCTIIIVPSRSFFCRQNGPYIILLLLLFFVHIHM